MQKNTTTSRPPTEQKIALQFNQESPLTVIVNETVPHRTTLHSVLSCQKSFKKIIYCDSTSLSTAQDLLSQLSRHTTAFSPSTNKKIKQQLTSIIKDFQQQDHRFLFVITQSEKLSLDVIAAFAHLSLLQEQSSLVMPIILCGTSTTHEKVCLIQPQHLHLFQLSHLTYTQRSPASFKTLISTFNIKQWLDNFISNTKPITITLSIAFTILCGGFLFSPLH